MDISVKAILFIEKEWAHTRLWGMTLYEKTMRQLASAGITECVLVTSPQMPPLEIRKDFADWFDLKYKSEIFSGNEITTLSSILADHTGDFVVIHGSSIYDSRLFENLLQAMKASEGDRAINIETGTESYLFAINRMTLDRVKAGSDGSLRNLLSNTDLVAGIQPDEMDNYIVKLRKHVVPYALPVDSPESLRKAERIAFDSVYKGATDFITKWAYPTPVRLLVKLVSPTPITPNHITIVSVILAFGAIPLYALGVYVPAVIMGIVMSLLDSLDGKLARLTVRSSTVGHYLDHVADVIYLPIWYISLGWSLCAGNLLNFESVMVQATWALAALYVADRLLVQLFRSSMRANLNDYTPLDYNARIFIARRNPFLVCVTVGLILGKPEIGLYGIACWQALTFLFHLVRAIYLPLSGKPHQLEELKSKKETSTPGSMS